MLDIDACALTHCGKIRLNNEDSVVLLRPHNRAQQHLHGLLAIVADGMGGYEGGEVASRIATETVARSFSRYSNSGLAPGAALKAAFAEANRAIFQTAVANPMFSGMGTTCIAVVVRDDLAWWAWIGDSRLYLLRDGRACRLSEDHTLVQQMLRRGFITPEEARKHRDRGLLERAMGVVEQAEPGLSAKAIRLKPVDRLLLCSDGLYDLIDDQELAANVAECSAAEGAEKLLSLALERGGHDNISLILLAATAGVSVPL